MMALPISVVIATHNRCEELRTTLTSLCDHGDAAEIIVVDNHSSDGTASLVKREFPQVKLIGRHCNEGVPAFGIGVQQSSEPYVILLDDDAVPEVYTMQRVIEIFERSPRTAAVACHIVDPSGKPVTDKWHRHPLCFWGCGAGLRKSALAGQPYMYDPRLFLHGTEMDLAVRLYAAGYCIEYSADATVHHRFSTTNRSQAKRMYFLVKSAIRFATKHMPLRFAIPSVSRHLTILLYRAIRQHSLSVYMRGLKDAWKEWPQALDERCPVPTTIAKIFYKQVWEYEPLTARLVRFIVGWPPSRRDVVQGFPVCADSQTAIEDGFDL